VEGKLEVPLAERIAAIRARKAQERARAKEKLARRSGNVQAPPHTSRAPAAPSHAPRAPAAPTRSANPRHGQSGESSPYRDGSSPRRGRDRRR